MRAIQREIQREDYRDSEQPAANTSSLFLSLPLVDPPTSVDIAKEQPSTFALADGARAVAGRVVQGERRDGKGENDGGRSERGMKERKGEREKREYG